MVTDNTHTAEQNNNEIIKRVVEHGQLTGITKLEKQTSCSHCAKKRSAHVNTKI